jgi:signal transduction histidine kinase
MGQVAVQRSAQGILQRERARIARDIHDDLGAGLTQLVLYGEVAQRETPAGSDTRAKFNWLCEKGRSLLGAIDETVWAVNSRRDTFGDFETYVCSYAEKFLKATPIRCSLEADADIPDRPFALASRRNLFLAIKEALNNAVKHSGATELTLNIHLQGDTIVVKVEDNGRGFDVSAANAERNGLSNIAQRAAEAGGTCRIASQPGAGCRVELSVPLVHPAQRSLRWWSRRGDAKAAKQGTPQPTTSANPH